MDDGKCLLDVISDPQALKEFFRSPSQIAFVEGNIPPLTEESDNKKNKQQAGQDTARSDNISFSTCNSQTPNTQSSRPSSMSGHINKQTNPLAHISYLSGSINSEGQLPNNPLINNGSKNNIVSSSLTTANNQMVVISSVNSTSKLISASNVQNMNTLSSSKATALTPQTFGNVPLSFAFSEAGKARNVLSSGSVSLSAVEKPMVVSPKQTINQQPQNLKTTSPRNILSPQAGLNASNRAQSLKGSPLPTLRPKGIMPKPQNVTSPLSGTSQITIQGNTVSQGIKTTPIKGPQQLVSIRPKLIITQPNSTEPGQSQSNLGALTPRPKQPMQNSFNLGAKVQQQVPKQLLNSLTVPQLKAGISTQPVGKSALAGLVQLQPKQIAPKPDVSGVQAVGKSKLTQDQTQLQLVQSLLAQSQTQFGIQSNVGTTTAQKVLKEATNSSQESTVYQLLVEQQNRLKKLQQKQLLQQAFQGGAQQQQQQSVALVQLKSPPTTTNSLTVSQQQKVQIPSGQTAISVSTLATQLKEAINTKQLQQFLEKNPTVAQQLKQLNMRQAALAGNTRQPALITGNTVSTAVTPSSSKLVTQSQKPPAIVTQLQKPALNQVQLPMATVSQLQKQSLNQLQIPTTVVTQLQKPVMNQLPKAVTTVTHLQKPVTTVSNTQKPVATIAQLPKAGVTHVTIPTPNKATTSTGQATQLQKTDQKPLTAQKVVIVQQSNTNTATATAGQPKVLLQTKEGRPILLSQEQFRQLQAQLASKNLSIQGKLVTTAPVTSTASTVKPQVVVKSEANASKVNQKVLPTTSKAQTKQEVTKAVKRPIKPVETQESKLIKRMKLNVQKDQNDVCLTDIHKPFKTHQEAIKRLAPYHVCSEPIPNARMQRKANALLDKLAVQLTYKSDKMINKYRHLLLNDMQRDVPSAEVVMVNRIFLADEKAALMKERKALLDEAKQMAQTTKATLAQIKTNTAVNDSTSTEITTNQPSIFSTPDDLATIQIDASEPAHIEISDDDSSPMTSANSFFTEESQSGTDLGAKRKLEPG